MNKQELIDSVAEQTEISRAQIGKVVDALLHTIKEAVVGGDAVQFIGFGSFNPGERAPRSGRNPKTGEPLEIAGTKIVKFIAGKAFKDALNSK